MFIGLNPDFRDNNVDLHGRVEGGWLLGEWSYSGIGGPIARGRFVARR